MGHHVGIECLRNCLINCTVVENYTTDVRGKVKDALVGIASEDRMQEAVNTGVQERRMEDVVVVPNCV